MPQKQALEGPLLPAPTAANQLVILCGGALGGSLLGNRVRLLGTLPAGLPRIEPPSHGNGNASNAAHTHTGTGARAGDSRNGNSSEPGRSAGRQNTDWLELHPSLRCRRSQILSE
jgi:hypothetical protein